jgi:Na+-transporting NADH:ubiquinone oxidoreductase subunit NqrD
MTFFIFISLIQAVIYGDKCIMSLILESKVDYVVGIFDAYTFKISDVGIVRLQTIMSHTSVMMRAEEISRTKNGIIFLGSEANQDGMTVWIGIR